MQNWPVNFCAPFLPNDPTINFHRLVQSSILLSFTLFYISVYIYFLLCASQNNSSEDEQPVKNRIVTRRKDEKDSQNSDSSSDNKELSLKCDQVPNQSCIQLKKTVSTWNRSGVQSHQSKREDKEISLQTIKDYFPIVFGHFAVSIGISIIYTPYAQQSLACLLYILLSFPLLVSNARKSKLTTRFLWIVMVLILVYLFTCGLLEVGQSNWDILNLQCFSEAYVPLYA